VFFLITDISAFGGGLFYNPVLSTTRAWTIPVTSSAQAPTPACSWRTLRT